MKYVTAIGLTTLLLLCLVVSVSAQLTDKDISRLREEGKVEGWTFTVGQNPATQYSLSQLAGLKVPANWETLAPFDNIPVTNSLPTSFDWRTQAGGLPPVRNQGGCGSCWAFATAGALECAIKIKDQTVVDLSEQWLVSCNRDGYSCSGGWWVHHYFQSATDRCGGSGSVYEKDYPYTQSNGSCNCPYPHDYHIDRWAYIGTPGSVPSVAQLKQAIVDHGPIAVAFHAGDAFQAYTGGILNRCETGDINHAVVLVGWDDNQGTGVWFMRNSWGAGWGEGGYCRIPYNCSAIGYNATYIVYPGRVTVNSDSTFGRPPLPVNFSITTGLGPTSYAWSFGDGGTSTEAAPAHVYQNPGAYKVSVTIQCPDGQHSANMEKSIAVVADTLAGPRVVSTKGKSVRVDISAHNYVPLSQMIIPMSWAGPLGLTFDSSSTKGLRTAALTDTGFMHLDAWTYFRATYRIAPGSEQGDIPAGSGPVLSLYFTPSPNAESAENPITIAEYDDGRELRTPQFVYSGGSYVPEIVSPVMVICRAGDVSADNTGPDLTDLSYLVAYLTGGMSTVPSMINSDVNGTGKVDLADLSCLVSYLTGGGYQPICK